MADNETTADIIAWLRRPREGENAYLTLWRDEIADRLEAAHKREREAITPKSNPCWKDICAKCMEGDIEPHNCEYYGEPNGCNSPIYGEHPTAEKSSAVGDAAKLREALEFCVKGMCGFCRMDAEARGMTTECVNGCEALRKAKAALDAPPRNCDKYANHNDAMKAFDAFVREQGKLGFINPYTEAFKWLFATATEGGAK